MSIESPSFGTRYKFDEREKEIYLTVKYLKVPPSIGIECCHGICSCVTHTGSLWEIVLQKQHHSQIKHAKNYYILTDVYLKDWFVILGNTHIHVLAEG